MKDSNVTSYKGVPLTERITEVIIDSIIEHRDNLNTKELAELVGLDSFRSVVGILKHLNREAGIVPKKPKVKKPKIVVREAKNTYKNYDGSGKAKARRLIGEAIMLTKRQSSNILTLPAEKWAMEKNILKKKSGYKFTAVERDKGTWQEMMKNMMSNPMLLDSVIATANKSIGEVIVNDGEDTYSSAILDYCGFIDSFYDEIDDVMKRNLVKKGGYIAITLSDNDRHLNHPHHKNNFSNTYVRNCYCEKEMKDLSGAKVTNDLVNNLVYGNKGYEIVTKTKYRDTKTNMLLFVIKRIDD
jgi:hypothetical protein